MHITAGIMAQCSLHCISCRVLAGPSTSLRATPSSCQRQWRPPCSAPGASSVVVRLLPAPAAAALPPPAAAAEGPKTRSAAISTLATAAGIRADGDRCMRGGVGLRLGMPAPAAAESMSRERIDLKLLPAARAGLLGALLGGGLGDGGLPAATIVMHTRHAIIIALALC